MTWDPSTFTLTVHFTGNEVYSSSTGYESIAQKVYVGDGFKTIPENCFSQYKVLQYLYLPDSITNIGNSAIANTHLISLYIPLDLKEINPWQPFDSQLTLEEFTIKEEHPLFTVFDGSLYSKDRKILYYYPGGKKDKVVYIPEGTEHLFCGAIAASNYIEEIVIPPSVTKIESWFGYMVYSLKKVTVLHCSKENPESNINWNKDSVFRDTQFKYEQVEWKYQTYSYEVFNSHHLTVIPNNKCPFDSFPIIYNDTKFQNSNIKSLSFGRGIHAIKGECFKGCSSLSKIAFPETITYIDPKAFFNCNSLKKYSSISFPSGLEKILKPAFNSYLLGLCKITSIHCKSRTNLIFLIILTI